MDRPRVREKRNLIVFSYDFPPDNGGIARLCQEISIRMNTKYDEVQVLTRKKKGDNIPYNSGQIKVISMPHTRIICEIFSLFYLLKTKRKKQVDILCGIWHPELLISFLAGFKNIFVLGHGTEFLAGTSKFRKDFWLNRYAKWILSKAKLIINNSHYTTGLVKDLNPNLNTQTLPLAVNQEFFRPLSIAKDVHTLKLCSVSRIQQFKGHDFIAKTIAKLPEDIKSKIYWEIAGTGAYLFELKKIIEDLGLSKQVKFLGFVSDTELPAFYNRNDVFILCSRENPNSTEVEGFGLVFLEAQSCGIPSIGTNTGGISDAVKHENGGWLISQDNETELSELLRNLVLNEQVKIDAGLAARKRVEQDCTWDGYIDNLANAILQTK